MGALDNFRVNLKSLLIAKGFSASELARRIEMPRSNLSLYINGATDPSVPTIERIANALETTVADLLSDDETNQVAELKKPMTLEAREQVQEIANLAAKFAIKSEIAPIKKQLRDALAQIEAGNEIIELQKQELIKLRKERAGEIQSSSPTLSPVRRDFTNLIASSPLDDSQLEDLLDAIREPILGELHEPKQKKRTR